MSNFEEHGFDVVRGVINEQTACLLGLEFSLLRDNHFISNRVSFDQIGFCNDVQVTKSFSWYSPYCFEALLQYIHPMMESVTGKKLYPAYSYARIYYNGATMNRHIDRPSCQYSATMTISVDDTGPWGIGIKSNSGKEHELSLNVGDMLVYRGDKLEHWRDTPYTGNKQIQAFLHFVDVDGEYADFKFDKRLMLGQPSNTRG